MEAATEHLDALGALFLRAGVMHPTAPYTLIRASIETGSTAVWLLAPARRQERVLRSLRLSVLDAIDAAKVSDETGTTMPRSLDARRADINRIAQTLTGTADSVGPASYTVIVRAADAVSASPIGVLAPYRICSGFAHGRLWAILAMLPREVVDSPDSPGDAGLVFTNALDRLTYAVMAAVDVVNLGLQLYRTRAASPYASR
jgi:hypothetical protein